MGVLDTSIKFLEKLLDVNIASPVDGRPVVWDAATSKYLNEDSKVTMSSSLLTGYVNTYENVRGNSETVGDSIYQATNAIYTLGFFKQMTVSTVVDAIKCSVFCVNPARNITMRIFITSGSAPNNDNITTFPAAYTQVIPAANFPHINQVSTFLLNQTLTVPANSYITVVFTSTAVSEIAIAKFSSNASSPARASFYFAGSNNLLTQSNTGTSLYATDFQLFSMQNINGSTSVSYQTPNGDTEITGNASYGAGTTARVLAYYEIMTGDITFNQIRANVWCTNQARAITMTIYQRSNAASFIPSTTPALFTITFPAGTFPSAAGISTFNLGQAITAYLAKGSYLVIMFDNEAQSTAELNFGTWNVQNGSSTRHSFLYATNNASGTIQSNLGGGLYQSTYELLLYGQTIVGVEQVLNYISANNIRYDTRNSLAFQTTVQAAIDYLYANGGTGSGVAANVTYSNSASGISQTNVQTAIDYLASQLPWTYIILPSTIYAVQGFELNAYFENFIISEIPISQLDIDISCVKGAHFGNFWRYTPVSSDAGSVSMTVNVYYNDILIATQVCTLITAATSQSSRSKSVICIGDSLTADATYLTAINTSQSGDPLTITFKGTSGVSPENSEGHGGYQWSDYTTAGRTLYKFIVSGIVTPPAIDAVYTNNGAQWEVVEVNLTSGSGYISCTNVAGGGTPQASGTLVKSSGVGDVNINYSSYSITGGSTSNPFWNTSTSAVDFANYLSTNSITMSSGDIVTILLGTNDMLGATSSTLSSVVASIIASANTLISNFQAAVPGLKIAIMMTIPPAGSQDASGASYSNNQRRFGYYYKLQALWNAYILNFDTPAMKTAGVYVLPIHMSIDTVNNWTITTWNANARNTTQINTYTNMVHPAASGYDQMGDALWAAFKNLL